MSEKMKKEFDDFMQDTYDEQELQYMDSGFLNAMQVAFENGWQSGARQSNMPKAMQCLVCGGYHGGGNLPCPIMQFTCIGA